MAEAPRLRPVAEDLDRLAVERGGHEARNDHAVLTALTRPDGVEQAHDHAVEPALLVVREGEKLVERLRLRIRPAPCGGRPVHPLALFAECLGLAPVAVHLGRGRDEHALAEAMTVIEHLFGPLDVRDERVHGLLDDQPDADGCSEMEDDVAAMHELV